MKSVVHDFRERLEHSLTLSDEGAWVDFYRRIWPDMISCVRLDADSPLQRAGVDRAVFLPTRQTPLYIDEKKRDKDWGDFLLEEWSVFYGDRNARNKVGWSLDKSKVCDFVAYAAPGMCRLLPFELLRLACEAFLPEWKAKPNAYPKDARNNGYVTRNCSVSWTDLWRGMFAVSRQDWGKTLDLPQIVRFHKDQLVFDWSAAK